MKSQKGITLISLTIYIIAMVIVIAVIAIISTFFYSNLSSATEQVNPSIEYTKFSSFFTDEVNHSNIKILECKNNYIAFDNGVQYTFVPENKGIYRNKVKIAREITMCKFSTMIENGKNMVKVSIDIEGKTRDSTFVLKN